jgi:hypothetical protein
MSWVGAAEARLKSSPGQKVVQSEYDVMSLHVPAILAQVIKLLLSTGLQTHELCRVPSISSASVLKETVPA